jgi:hypothetical protein
MQIEKDLHLPELHADEEKPLGGWVCAGLGIGFVVLLGCLLVAVRVLSG